MSAGSLTTHTCTTWPSRCTCFRNALETTRMRPAFSGTWNATHGRAFVQGHRTHDRCSDHRASSCDALVVTCGNSRANRIDRALMEGSDTGALDRVCLLDRFADGSRQLRLPAFHLDDHARTGVFRQHVIEPRHAYSLSAKRMPAVDLEMKTRIDLRELRRGEAAKRGRCDRSCDRASDRG